MSTVHTDAERQERLLALTKGAPDVLLARCGEELVGEAPRPLTPERRAEILRTNDELADKALRTLGVAFRSIPKGGVRNGELDDRIERGLVFLGLIGMIDPPRQEAKEAVARAKRAGIRPIMITGDHPRTAAVIAAELGVATDGVVTGTELERMPETALDDTVREVSVYARVNPEHKLRIVKALQRQGATVAMTGDGVNDALALKDADIGVAMGNGAPATRAVAQLVLLDGRFAVLPKVVAEGRRVIANIERVASLFLIKNVYSALLAVAVAVVAVPYPFLPRHLTLVSMLTIGIPAFVLSLAPSNERYRPGFLRRVLAVSVPTGIITAVAVFCSYALARAEEVHPDEARTAATVTAMVIGLVVLLLVAEPLVLWKVALVAAMGGIFAATMAIPRTREFFALYLPWFTLAQSLVIGAVASIMVFLAWRLARRRLVQPSDEVASDRSHQATDADPVRAESA
jgi:magnesium-transporting ATPase (P-type)